MALINLLPRTITTTGASCSGTTGTANRTYTLPDTGVVSEGIVITVNGTGLHEGSSYDFTRADNVITFLNVVWDAQIITINYFITFGTPAASTLSTSADLKYATPLMLGESIGVIKDIPSWDVAGTPTKEVVGTGDGSTATFYLDQKSVVSDSYTFYHGPDADTLTALTETTHYTLDNDTGTITLTTAGKAEVSTDKIYATYKYYSNGMKDSYVISVLSRAEKEVDMVTNTTFTDGTVTNPSYPLETEYQPTEGLYMDRFITMKKPVVNVISTLSGDITSSDTTIGVATSTGADFPSSGYIIIGSEVITYTGVTTDDLTGCTRGCLGTTAAAHSTSDEVHSTVVFLSDTDEGTAESWTVQPWGTSTYVTDEGLIYRYKDADPDPLTRAGIAKRLKIIYLYGHDTVPADITRLTLLLAKRMLMQDNISKAMIAGRNEFNPELFNADQEEINRIINSYRILSMGNT